MPHFLIKRTESLPDFGSSKKKTFLGPFTETNPETAVQKHINTEPTVHGGSVEISVYELADDGEGNPVVYEKEDLEL